MKNKKDYFCLLIPIVYIVLAMVIVRLVMMNGVYPQGSDTMYHIFRGQYVYNSILNGDWYPMLAREWYNGVELLRYWAPLPAYFMAFCIFLASGNVLDGYLIFVGLIFYLGALSWLWIGWRRRRVCLGAFLGVVWFFMPNNLLALFVEGNLARCVCMVFLPLYIHSLWEFLETRKIRWTASQMVLFSLMALCHLGYAGMIAIGVLLYLFLYRLIYGPQSGISHAIFGMIVGFLLIGVWMIPSLSGGFTGLDNAENMANFFQSGFTSLNPLDRYESQFSYFYFGLAAFLVAVTGAFLGEKKGQPGFIASLLIFAGTTNSAYQVLRLLPGSKYLWMLRFISIALCMILYSLLEWKSLKRYILLIFLALLVADTVPSLSLVYGSGEGSPAEERLDEMQKATLIQEGLQVTEQRMALLDASTLGASGAYLVSGWNDGKNATFGAGWEAAVTAQNIRNLSAAFSGGYYVYMFDRCKELGNDTIVIKLGCIPKGESVRRNLEAAANLVGYTKVKGNANYELYHLEGASGNWGLQTQYENICIGENAFHTAVQFPSCEESSSTNLSDFTFEDLVKYKTVYLGTFHYDDREEAENLILRLAEAGVKIVISADGIPEDNKTHNQSFLGARCEKISFQNGYPELMIYDRLIYPDLFPQAYADWDTVYVEGLDRVDGYLLENEQEIPFMGMVANENIVVVGIRLPQFCWLTGDKAIQSALGDVLGVNNEKVPERKMIPLSIEYGRNSVRIESPEDDVNTTLAFHDIFQSDQEITAVNNLLVVNAGVTDISFEYRQLWQGILVSVLGVLLFIGYLWENLRKKPEKRRQLMEMKVLITGPDNELKKKVLQEVEKREYTAIQPGHDELDLTDDYSIERIIGRLKPDLVIHCAAYGPVIAENGEVRYGKTKAAGTERLRDACGVYNIPMIEDIDERDKLPLPAEELAVLLVTARTNYEGEL